MGEGLADLGAIHRKEHWWHNQRSREVTNTEQELKNSRFVISDIKWEEEVKDQAVCFCLERRLWFCSFYFHTRNRTGGIERHRAKSSDRSLMIFVLLKTTCLGTKMGWEVLFLKCEWFSHVSVLREPERMGRLKISAMEKAGHEGLEVSGKVSSESVVISYIATVSALCFGLVWTKLP